MVLKILYESIDPYYSSVTQTFIGVDEEDCWNQKYEFEEWLGRNHPNGIRCIYRDKILDEKWILERLNLEVKTTKQVNGRKDISFSD